MHWRNIFAALFLTASFVPAADDLFDFSDLDVVDPPATEKDDESERPPAEDDPLTALPESIRTVLGKLDRFSASKRSALMKEIAAGRKVAAEILVNSATRSDAATRAALLNEAKRVESLPPERPLIETAGSSPATQALALGKWESPQKNKWSITLATDGILTHSNGKMGRWYWVDEKRGVFVCDYTHMEAHADLFQIDPKSKPLKASGLSASGHVFPMGKTGSTSIPVAKKATPVEPVTKLAAHETATRKETEKLIQSKNTKVAAWLLQEARSLPAPHARVVVERASELEGKPAAAVGVKGSNSFEGVWSWAGKKLEFAEGGIVKVNKSSAGKWIWAKGNRSLIAFVLDAGDTAGMARLSTSKEGVLHIMPTKGKQSEARRE